MFNNQKILPAIRDMRYVEKMMKSPYEYFVVLDLHIGHIQHIIQRAKMYNKKIILHMDLIRGIQNDAYGVEYVCQQFHPFGIMSTKSNVIMKAKKKNVAVIQRIFLLDSSSLEKSYSLLEKTQPDALEILPGAMPHIIREVKEKTNVPILAGGFIRSQEDVIHALEAGATAITTSNMELWEKQCVFSN